MSTFMKAAAVTAAVLVALSVVPVAEKFAAAAMPARGVRYVADDGRAHIAAERPAARLH